MERLKLNIQRFASGTISFSDNGSMSGKIEWSSTVVGSTAAEKAQLNKSSVTAILYVRRNDGYSTWGDFTGYLSIHESTQNFYPVWITASSSWVEVARKTIEVQHNNNGTGSALITGSVTGPTETTWEGKMVTGSKVVTLDTIPRYTTVSTWSVVSKTETSITLNWKTADTCSQIRYGTSTSSYTTANVNSNSGTVTISGLTAEETYTLYFMPKRKDSNLWGDGSDTTWKSLTNQATYNYPNCTSAPNFTIGNSVTLQFYNPLNRTFDIRLWSHTSQSFVSDSITISGTSYTFTPNASTLYASIPNSKSSVYNVDSTYNTHKIVKTGGSYSVNETTSKPTFNDFTYEDTNATTLALTGDSSIVVQNYSNVRARISVANKAVAQNSTTMKQYNLVIGNAPQVSANYSDDEEVITPEVNNASSNIINLYAEDNRGLTTLVSKTAVLKEYTNIQKGNISITRAGNVGKSVTLTFNGTFWNDSFGDVTNSITNVTYRYKTTSSTQWTTGTTTIVPTASNNNYSFSGSIAGDDGNNGFSVENSFNIEITVSDRLSSTTFTVVLGTGTPLIAKHNNGVAIKQPYDTSDDSVLQVNGKTHLKGNTTITGDENVSGNFTTGSFHGRPYDFDTNNTTDTWVPVAGNGKWQHRAIPTAYNSTTPALDGVNFRNKNSATIEWKENGYGDKFRLIPDFGGTDDSNKFKVQGTVGGSGTDPTNWKDLLTLSGKTGNLVIGGTFKSTGISIVDGGNSWKKVDIGFCRVYFKTGTIPSRSYSGYSWGYGPDIPLPSGITFNADKMACSCNARMGDNAISFNMCAYGGQTNIWTNYRNSYSGTVTCDGRFNAILIDFS